MLVLCYSFDRLDDLKVYFCIVCQDFEEEVHVRSNGLQGEEEAAAIEKFTLTAHRWGSPMKSRGETDDLVRASWIQFLVHLYFTSFLFAFSLYTLKKTLLVLVGGFFDGFFAFSSNPKK